MAEEGTTATEYEPYFEGLKSATVTTVKSYAADGTLLSTYTVPDAVRALDGYGMGLSLDSNNGIDFERNLFVKRNSLVQVSADWNWAANSATNGSYYAQHGLEDIAAFRHCFCNTFEGAPRAAYDGSGNNIISFAKDMAWIKSTDYTSVNELKAFLREHPTYVVYMLKEPVVTDLSGILPATPYIKVEQGGYIEAISEDGIPAALTVTYQIENET